jgi:hypothetical protein
MPRRTSKDQKLKPLKQPAATQLIVAAQKRPAYIGKVLDCVAKV